MKNSIIRKSFTKIIKCVVKILISFLWCGYVDRLHSNAPNPTMLLEWDNKIVDWIRVKLMRNTCVDIHFPRR